MNSEITVIVIQAALALVTIAGYFLNRRESKSRADNFDATTDKIRNDILDQLQSQYDTFKKSWLTEKKELLEELEKQEAQIKSLNIDNREKDEKFERETVRWRDGYRKLEEQIREIGADLRAERERNTRLDVELRDARRNSDAARESYIIKIDELTRKLEGHSAEIKELKTGPLPSREDLGKNLGK